MDGNDFDTVDLMQVFTAALANGAAGNPSVEIDLNEFLHHLEEVDATEEEKLQLLGTIANYMIPFVEMGFGIHPVQQACGQVVEEFGDAAKAESDVLDSKLSERIIE